MRFLRYLHYLTIEPVSLSIREKCIAALAAFSAILLTGIVTRSYAAEQTAILVASMGASAAILFAIPNSPLAQPWPFAGGQILSALVGVTCAAYIDDIPMAAAMSAGSAILAMLILRCLHPPGAATALAPVLSANPSFYPNLDFVLVPVGINVLLMLILACLINGAILKRDYPARPPSAKPKTIPNKTPGKLLGIDPGDLEQVTRDFDHFLDIGNEELLQLFTRLQLLTFQKRIAPLTCGAIMQRNIVTVEYHTEVESAWAIMHERQLKALPVLDKSRRVIGIVTRYDFFKNLTLTPYRGFQDKWLTFLKSSTEVYTDKPEAIGHIMTRKVKTLTVNSDIAQLFPLIVDEGHHHIPIIDESGRFAGMVFQSQLLATVFKQVTNASPDA